MIGKVVAWRDVPVGALVWVEGGTLSDIDAAWIRTAQDTGVRVMGALGWYANRVPHIWSAIAPRLSADRRRRAKVVIVATGLTGDEPVRDLSRLAEVFVLSGVE